MSDFPDAGVTAAIWIGVIGKTLVKKGLLQKQDLIDELEDVKRRLQPVTNVNQGTIAEVDNMIATVNRW